MNYKVDLEKLYNNILIEYDLELPLDATTICREIGNILCDFLSDKKKPAIYASGGHTKMLMTDYMFELKKVKFIIDNYCEKHIGDGFELIRDEDIQAHEIDGIVISSYKYRQAIKERLQKLYPDIPVLDIYEKIQEKGINLNADYYYNNHPFQHYHLINKYIRQAECEEKYINMITKLLHIKDIRLALVYANVLEKKYFTQKNTALRKDIEKLWNLVLSAFGQLNKKNIVLICLDGLRRQDLCEKYMPHISESIENKGCLFTKMYSHSTSTFESLMAVYSENNDLRTEYYKQNFVNGQDCRFIVKAKEQNREIFFYTDMDSYVRDEKINYMNSFQTLTEKLWHFLLDSQCSEQCFSLIHELYETHYSFSNPYTEEELLSEGTAMLFDYLPQKGGRIRANYEKQHLDALRYVDDTLSPILNVCKMPIVLYADHGNIILNEATKKEQIREIDLTCSEEWIQVPLAILNCPEFKGYKKQASSLMDLNEIVVKILEGKNYIAKKRKYIKIGRSELYNPDFRALYSSLGFEEDLLAFEGYIFDGGLKLVIFSNGHIKVYKNDLLQNCDAIKEYKELVEEIKNDLTVCTEEELY